MKVILALYPNTRGIGYACVDMPEKLLDYGIITVSPVSNGKIMERVKKFTDYFKPEIVVVRDSQPLTRRGTRIEKLTDEIEAHAKQMGIPVFRYSRRQVKDAFEVFGATTKYEIARKLIGWFSDLEIRMPKLRKAWQKEDHNMGIFDAVALAVTHEHLGL